jgi:hypothetical protein
LDANSSSDGGEVFRC